MMPAASVERNGRHDPRGIERVTDNETIGRLWAWVQTTDLQPTTAVQTLMRYARAAGFRINLRTAQAFVQQWRAYVIAQRGESAP